MEPIAKLSIQRKLNVQRDQQQPKIGLAFRQFIKNGNKYIYISIF